MAEPTAKSNRAQRPPALAGWFDRRNCRGRDRKVCSGFRCASAVHRWCGPERTPGHASRLARSLRGAWPCPRHIPRGRAIRRQGIPQSGCHREGTRYFFDPDPTSLVRLCHIASTPEDPRVERRRGSPRETTRNNPTNGATSDSAKRSNRRWSRRVARLVSRMAALLVPCGCLRHVGKDQARWTVGDHWAPPSSSAASARRRRRRGDSVLRTAWRG